MESNYEYYPLLVDDVPNGNVLSPYQITQTRYVRPTSIVYVEEDTPEHHAKLMSNYFNSEVQKSHFDGNIYTFEID
jgi:hypothetical protein